MTFWTLIFRSLRFHARSHSSTLLGAAMGSAVLIGALVVGDSVKESLRETAANRIGGIDFALASGERFFRSRLASDLKAEFPTAPAAALQLWGTLVNEDRSTRANQVQVLGVDDAFWSLGLRSSATEMNLPVPADDEIFLNKPLGKKLSVQIGDTVLLRMPKPSQLSREVPISPQEDFSAILRLRVAKILGDDQFGRFSLQANQAMPLNAFVSRNLLQTKLGLAGKANLLLLSHPDTRHPVTDQKPPDLILPTRATLTDYQMELRDLTNPQPRWELRSERIFLDEPISKAALTISPSATGILTYFVNELRVSTNPTPYSMVTAASAPLVPAEMRDDEILISQWLADDLQAKPGDELTLRYFIMGSAQRLEEKTNSFRIRAIVPMEGDYADRTLMPEFPGIAQAEKTENWDAGFSIDLKKIRPKDEKYWEDFRGTPKAFVTLAAGQKMWANRFGNLTAIRFPSPSQGEGQGASHSQIETALLKNINPASLGLRFASVREQARAAANNAQDFGGLFLGFSFFLIAAALILMGLLFQFSLEQRAEEIGTLLALGFRPRQVRRVLLAEGIFIAAIGGILGSIGGMAYAQAMLHGLNTTWNSAIAGSQIHFHVSAPTFFIGLFASIVVSAITIWLVLRKQARQTARELLSGDNFPFAIFHSQIPLRRRAEWIFLSAALSAAGLMGWTISKNEKSSSEIFFSAGSLLLIAGLAAVATLLKKLAVAESQWGPRPPRSLFSAPSRKTSNLEFSMAGMSLRNATRRRQRSLATVALLASGTFMIVAVGAFRLETTEAAKKSSGTGGFTFLGETTLPVVQNLNEASGRDFFGLNEKDLADVKFVPLRVRDGDEASCLNLNRAQKPRLLGVNPELLKERFTFSQSEKDAAKQNAWDFLRSSKNQERDFLSPAHGGGDQGEGERQRIVSPSNTSEANPSPLSSPQIGRGDTPGAEEIPAIGDAASIQWALGKKIGDTLDYADERGNKFQLRLVGGVKNSILQGSLLIDERAFLKLFPNETGYRMFLIDSPSKNVNSTSATLSRALRDVGLELTPTTERLAALYAVQNTYLNTFQILGGLGLLLGSAGLGIVVLRNVLERRSELALLTAVGFRHRSLRRLVLSEHAALLLLGLAVGVAAAAIAILPALLAPAAALPYRSLGLTLLGVFAIGLLSTWLATKIALRGELLKALRNE